VRKLKNTLEFLIAKTNTNKSKLARELGISRQTVINLCNGKAPSIETAMLIAEKFGKDVNEIFFIPNVQHIVQRGKKKSEPA
jgi:DNA-binding XRE family transcriptional regulator